MFPQTQQNTKIADYVAWMRAFGYSFRLNEITDQVELNGDPISDEQVSKIEYQLIEKGCTSERYTRVAIRASAYDNRYNPIKDYLSKLPYDGGHYFDQLVGCFENPDGLLPVYLRKWMLGAVSKAIQNTQNRMLIFDGPQGIGKSLFVRWLCSGVPDYFAEGSIDADNKDTQIRLTSRWIWEVGELGATFRKSDREALKNLITQQTLTFRRPFGRFDCTKPVLANLFGTINNEGGFLDDPTGSRRFMICDIRSIDWETYIQIDVNKLWGEIYAAYLIGEDTEFTRNQKIETEENNRNYEVDDPIELVLRDQFIIQPGNTLLWTSTAQITYIVQERLGKGGSPKSFQMALASTCKKLGLTRSQQGTQRGYFGISVKVP